MLLATIGRVYEYEDEMLRNLPILEKGQDMRTLPTYTIPEAAAALAIDAWTLTSWYTGPGPILKNSGWYGPAESIALLSFRDVEEAYKVYLLRHKFRQSMQYLKRALVHAREETGSEHPLLDHKIMVFNLLALEKPGRGREKRQMIPLGAGRQISYYIPEVVEAWGQRIVTDRSGKRTRIYPWIHAKSDEASRPVSMDPDVLSGRLVITGTRIPVQVIAGYVNSGKRIEDVARLYRLDTDTVRKALQHIGPKVPKIS
ncbi:MAG: DUF433 domain-containing protein [Acidobacteriaceae bacterium]